jgi:hypothetical protein
MRLYDRVKQSEKVISQKAMIIWKPVKGPEKTANGDVMKL